MQTLHTYFTHLHIIRHTYLPHPHYPAEKSQWRCAPPGGGVQSLRTLAGEPQTVREGVRLLEFVRQHDHHNELVVRRADLARALDTAGFPLSPLELQTLMEVFAAPGRRDWVEYARLADAVSEALTQGGLERAPLLTPVPHVPPAAGGSAPRLSPAERRDASRALTKIAARPDRLLGIFDLFQESDPGRCGRVTRSQTERALTLRGVMEGVSAPERAALYRWFRAGADEINYRALCGSLDVLLAAGAAARAAASTA